MKLNQLNKSLKEIRLEDNKFLLEGSVVSRERGGDSRDAVPVAGGRLVRACSQFWVLKETEQQSRLEFN